MVVGYKDSDTTQALNSMVVTRYQSSKCTLSYADWYFTNFPQAMPVLHVQSDSAELVMN